jgi:hypothetical protein
MPPLEPSESWRFLWIGYAYTVAIETVVLLVGLSKRHRLRDRLLAGIWLNACSYPIVILVFPYLVWGPFGRTAYLAVSETFAPLAECTLFWLAFGDPKERFRWSMYQDLATVVVANLASFLIGLWCLPPLEHYWLLAAAWPAGASVLGAGGLGCWKVL